MDDSSRIKVASTPLRDFCRQVFAKVGVPEDDARIAADVLVSADLRGIESHGVARLRGLYVSRLQSGVIAARPQIDVVSESLATAVLDGGRGLGHPIAHRAMRLALEKARQSGAGFVAVRNSNHFGIAGYYAMMALEHGCIGLCMTNTNRWTVPTFGRDPILGTNPLAVAVPAGKERPFVLDMATAIVPIGKLELYDRLHKQIPLGWATDEQGLPTDDPGLVLRNAQHSSGGLLPLGGAGEESGGHKGYGLALWVDIFSAMLSGAMYADMLYPREADGTPRESLVGHFFGAWRVDAFRPLADFQAGMDDLLQRLKNSPTAAGQERIYVAGEKEYEETERRLRDGIPLPAVVLRDLTALGAEVGLGLALT
jgi:LDH2 family malate/lactate/ureidoglycolate dehydrogenase